MMTIEKMLLVKKMNLQMSKQNYFTGNLERAKNTTIFLFLKK